MSIEEKIKIADEVMARMSAALGVEFTPAQKQFNRGYLVAMMDAAEHGLEPTVSRRAGFPRETIWNGRGVRPD